MCPVCIGLGHIYGSNQPTTLSYSNIKINSSHMLTGETEKTLI